MGRIQMQRITGRHYLYAGLVFALVVFLSLFANSALAATVEEGDTYHLASGQVLEDDLIVLAQTITIDGKVEGDLIALGQTIIVNGEVSNDVIAAGAEVVINGKVGDDVRLAGMHVMIEGQVGDDVLAAGGPAIPGTGPISVPINGRSIQGGVGSGSGATVGGDAYYAGGFVTLEGAYESDLKAGGAIVFFDASVQGNVNIETNDIRFGDSTFVAGNLSYSTQRETGTPEAEGEITKTKATETAMPAPVKETHPVLGFGWWLLRTILIIIGISIVGALAFTFTPQCLNQTVAVLRKKAVYAFLYGLLALIVYVPLSAALTFLAWLFFGWFWGAAAMLIFLMGLFILMWTFSPMLPGLWLGRAILNKTGILKGQVWALIVGVTLIILVTRIIGQIPCAGGFINMIIYTVMFSLTVGSTILMMTGSASDEPTAVTSVEEVDEAVVEEPGDDSVAGAAEDSQDGNGSETKPAG